jgi:hypothetical protein
MAIEYGLDPIAVYKLIMAHEAFEYAMLLNKYSWDIAHAKATEHEHFLADRLGVSWEVYQGKFYPAVCDKVKARGSIGPEDLCHKGKEIMEMLK